MRFQQPSAQTLHGRHEMGWIGAESSWEGKAWGAEKNPTATALDRPPAFWFLGCRQRRPRHRGAPPKNDDINEEPACLANGGGDTTTRRHDSCAWGETQLRHRWWLRTFGGKSRWVDATHTTATPIAPALPASFCSPNLTTEHNRRGVLPTVVGLAPGDSVDEHTHVVAAISWCVVASIGRVGGVRVRGCFFGRLKADAEVIQRGKAGGRRRRRRRRRRIGGPRQQQEGEERCGKAALEPEGLAGQEQRGRQGGAAASRNFYQRRTGSLVLQQLCPHQ